MTLDPGLADGKSQSHELLTSEDARTGRGRRILVDLSVATDGYSGIPQDTRLIFSMLSSCEDLSVSGLIYPLGRPAIPRIVPGYPDVPRRIAGAINGASLGWSSRRNEGRLRSLQMYAKRLRQAARSAHYVEIIPDWLKTDALWRLMFQKTLSPLERSAILQNDFFVSDISVGQITDRGTALSFLGNKYLAVTGQEIVLFPLPRPIRLPSTIKKVVRYHDAIPITHADTVVHWTDIAFHHRFTNSCARDSVFVCNSPMSRDDLDNVAPGAGERAAVIPCAIREIQPSQYKFDVNDILIRRMSMRATYVDDESAESASLRSQIERKLRGCDKFRFIMSVSTLEPRKNFESAIAAWERIRALTSLDIKFIMVASHGWKMNSILEAMRPHVLAGNLFHVHKLPALELHSLYQQAELCLFPSYAEGFGFAPLEALQMGTPTVVSDIPVFRWTLEDAAIYVDPYNVSEIAEGAMQLLKSSDNESRRRSILNSAKRVLNRFSTSTVKNQWRSFFLNELDDIYAEELARPARTK